jgi:hypothetical protein
MLKCTGVVVPGVPVFSWKDLVGMRGGMIVFKVVLSRLVISCGSKGRSVSEAVVGHNTATAILCFLHKAYKSQSKL